MVGFPPDGWWVAMMGDTLWIATRDGVGLYNPRLEQLYHETAGEMVVDADVALSGDLVAFVTTSTLHLVRWSNSVQNAVHTLIGAHGVIVLPDGERCIAFGEKRRRGYIALASVKNKNDFVALQELNTPVRNATNANDKVFVLTDASAIQLYELSSFVFISTLSVEAPPRRLIILDNRDDLLVLCKTGSLLVLDVVSGARQSIGNSESYVTCAALDRRQRLLVVGYGDGSLKVFETHGWTQTCCVESKGYLKQQDSDCGIKLFSGVSSISVSSDGLIAAAFSNEQVLCFDQQLKRLGGVIDRMSSKIALSKDGELLLCAGYKSTEVFKSCTSAPLAQIELTSEIVQCGWM